MRFPRGFHEVSMKFPRIDLELTSELTSNDLRIDLPHASLLCHAQNPVSVIIRCKQAKTSPLRIPR